MSTVKIAQKIGAIGHNSFQWLDLENIRYNTAIERKNQPCRIKPAAVTLNIDTGWVKFQWVD